MKRTKTQSAAKPVLRAKSFRETRAHHEDEAAEDYTELIAELIATCGEARTGVIAKHLGISHVTALRTMKRLQREGYLTTRNHRPIELTPKGRELAEFAKRRHRVLLEFLLALDVPPEQAEIDVEGAEHHISKVTLERIEELLRRLN